MIIDENYRTTRTSLVKKLDVGPYQDFRIPIKKDSDTIIKSTQQQNDYESDRNIQTNHSRTKEYTVQDLSSQTSSHTIPLLKNLQFKVKNNIKPDSQQIDDHNFSNKLLYNKAYKSLKLE